MAITTDTIFSDRNAGILGSFFSSPRCTALPNFMEEFQHMRSVGRELFEAAIREAQETKKPVIFDPSQQKTLGMLLGGRKIKIIPSSSGEIKHIILLGTDQTDWPFSGGSTKRAYHSFDLLTSTPEANVEASSTKSECVHKLEREVEVLCKLGDPSIHDIETSLEGGVYQLSICQKKGMNLAELLFPMASLSAAEKLERLPLDARLKITQNLIAYLARLHGLQIIHGDMSIGNVIIFEDGEAKLIDFELSRPFGYWEKSRLEGTKAFMSPEQAMALIGTDLSPMEEGALIAEATRFGIDTQSIFQDLHRVKQFVTRASFKTSASDVYTLGIILIEVLTGNECPPLVKNQSTIKDPSRRDLADTFYVAWRQYPAINLLRAFPGMPEGLFALIQSMVDRDPSARPSAQGALERINHILANQKGQVQDRPIPPTPPLLPFPPAHEVMPTGLLSHPELPSCVEES